MVLTLPVQYNTTVIKTHKTNKNWYREFVQKKWFYKQVEKENQKELKWMDAESKQNGFV